MIKICFYCDSIFSVGGVQRILAVIAGAISAKPRSDNTDPGQTRTRRSQYV